ncbi:MAG: prephenate dehydratase domain-containing protein [Verrucomicrobiia bacterium]
MSRSKTVAQIGYFGLPGSFAHEVALKHFPKKKLESFSSMALGFEKLKKSQLDRIVVPFENSIGGEVHDTLDQLILLGNSETDFGILEQLVYDIQLYLLGSTELKKIKRVYSHFVPLQVVSPWLQDHLPKVERIIAGSTSAAAELATQDRQGAAVGNQMATKVYSLKILAKNLVSPKTNVTRFFVIGKSKLKKRREKKGQRALLYLRLPNRPGALANILQFFKKFDMNLTQILSRPIYGSVGAYQFLLEVELPKHLPLSVWDKLKRNTLFFKMLGFYPLMKI